MKTPVNLKFRRYFLLTLENNTRFALKKSKLWYGILGIQFLYQKKLQHREIEAARISIKRNLFLKRFCFLWIRFFPYVSVTKKPVSMRMGKGKGNIAFWFAPFFRGQILFELVFNNKFKYHFFFTLIKACAKTKFRLSKISRLIFLIY